MTDTDIMILSIFFNIILLFNNWVLNKRHALLNELFGKTINIMGAIADGQAAVKRDSTGEIRIKDLRNETN